MLTLSHITHATEQQDRQKTGTMSYFSFKNNHSIAKSNKNDAVKHKKTKNFAIAPITAPSIQQAHSAKEREKNQFNKIWEKYQALASGQDSAPKAATIPVQPIKKVKMSNGQSTTPPSGIASIITQYHSNKQKRSQIRSLTIAKPRTQETMKTTIDTTKKE